MAFKYNVFTGDFDVVSDPSIGGTVTSGTPGSVLFVGGTTSAPTLAQDNQNFYWDDTYNRLSVFNTLGNEIVTNGTLTSNASGWTVPSGMAWSSGAISKTGNGTGALTKTFAGSMQREYLMTFVMSNVTAGTVTPSVAGFTGTAVSANGTYTERFVATASTQLAFTPSNTARFTIDSISIKPLKGTNTASNLNVGGFSIEGDWSNGSPGTTRPMTINNDGSYSWIDYRFAGVLRGTTGFNSSGGYDVYTSGGNGLAVYAGNSGLTFSSLAMYCTATALVGYGYGEFYGGVVAGAIQQPTSTLQSVGSTAMQVKRITSSQSIDGTATIWLSDATSAAACTGTPSAACSSWTNQTDCEKWDAHGGCVWNAGTSCSVYDNESGMTSCSGQAGCTVVTASCSGPTDQTTCESQDDSYGGSCAWSGNDCSGLPDEGTCTSYSGSGCTANYSDCSTYNDNYGGCTGQSGCTSSSATDCSAYDGTDQGTCEGNTGCYWDSMTNNCYMTCSGSYYTGCSGTYYNCTGTYNTGSCSGTYGSGCSGTSTCSGIDDSTNCGNETGCTWSSVLNLTLPDGETCTHRNYWIYNDATGGADTVIYPYSGQTVNETTSYTLAAYRDWVHLAYYKQTKDCSVYVTEGACTPTGCTKNYSYCSWNGMDSTCSGDGGSTCSAHNGNQSSCEAQQYFTSCSGTEVIRKNWYKVGS